MHRPAADGCEPYLNLGTAAKLVGVTPKTLRIAAEAGEIEAVHPLSDGPWIFSRRTLDGEGARSLADRACRRPKNPAGSNLDQQSLFPSTT